MKDFVLCCLLSTAVLADINLDGSICVGNGRCYNLYSANNGVNWSSSVSSCRALNSTLAVMSEDKEQLMLLQTHAVVKRPRGIGYTSRDLGSVWVSAVQTLSMHWVDVNGEMFKGSIRYDAASACGVYRFFDNSIRGRKCAIRTGLLKLSICQYINDSCGNHLEINNNCYVIPGRYFTSWQAANTYCRRQYPEGTLGHSNLETKRVRDYVRASLTSPRKYSLTTELWIGVTRYIWYWVTENATVPLGFVPPQKDAVDDRLGSDDLCLVLHLSLSESGWKAVSCNETIRHFLCREDARRLEQPEHRPPVPAGSADRTLMKPNSLRTIELLLGVFAFVSVLLGTIVLVLCLQRWRSTLESNKSTQSEMSDINVKSLISSSSQCDSEEHFATTPSADTDTSTQCRVYLELHDIRNSIPNVDFGDYVMTDTLHGTTERQCKYCTSTSTPVGDDVTLPTPFQYPTGTNDKKPTTCGEAIATISDTCLDTMEVNDIPNEYAEIRIVTDDLETFIYDVIRLSAVSGSSRLTDYEEV